MSNEQQKTTKPSFKEKILSGKFKPIAITIAGLVIVTGGYFFFSEETPDQFTKVPNPPLIDFVPGGETQNENPSYQEAVNQQNENLFNEAIQNNESSLPILNPKSENEITKPISPANNTEESILNRTKPKPKTAQEQRKTLNDNLYKAQKKQIEALSGYWTAPKTIYADNFNLEPPTKINADPVTPGPTSLLLKTGDILFARTITEATTKAPGPVLAEIISGPLTGYKILGQFSEGNRALVVSFQQLIPPEGGAIKIDAIAIDSDKATTAMVTKYKSNFVPRLLLNLGSAFVTGFAGAASQPQRTIVSSGLGFTQVEETPTTEQALYAGAASAANSVQTELQSEANRLRPIVTVGANTEFALLFLQDVDQIDE